jgi:hypothetical protein
MKMISVYTNARGDGHEILDELAKHPGWKIEAVFPLGHVHYSDDHRNFFLLLKPE